MRRLLLVMGFLGALLPQAALAQSKCGDFTENSDGRCQTAPVTIAKATLGNGATAFARGINAGVGTVRLHWAYSGFPEPSVRVVQPSGVTTNTTSGGEIFVGPGGSAEMTLSASEKVTGDLVVYWVADTPEALEGLSLVVATTSPRRPMGRPPK